MDQIKPILAPVEQVFNKTLKTYVSTDIAKYVINHLILISVILSVDSLPEEFKKIVSDKYTRLALLFFSLYFLTRDFSKAFMGVVASFIFLEFLSRELVTEKFTDLEVMPGCSKATVADLLSLFNGDRGKLIRAMYTIGIPLNLELSEENSPMIASYFVNHGKKVSESCSATTLTKSSSK